MKYIKWLTLNIIILVSISNSQDFKLLTPPILDLGTVRSDTIATGVIQFKNTGSEPIKIKNINTSCGCTVVEPKKLTYQPGEEGELPVRFNTKGFNGTTRKSVNIYLEKAEPSPVRVIVQATVQPRIDIEPRYLNMQNISLADENTNYSFQITNNMKKVLSGEIAELKNDLLKVEPMEFMLKPGEMQNFTVTYHPKKPGRDDGYISLKFSQPQKEEKRVPVFINVSP